VANATELEKISEALDELIEVDPSLAEVVDLKFFCGFTLEEIAEIKGVSERTMRRNWEKARLYLYESISSVCQREVIMSVHSRWKRASPYLDEALTLSEQEQSVWLASLREQDPDLAQDLQKLLQKQREVIEQRLPRRTSNFRSRTRAGVQAWPWARTR